MTLSIYNSLTRSKEVFTPRESGKVGMYLCGPTVYDRAHLGNARPVVVFDVLRRLLERSYKVTYVRNITDIDDKIMNAAKERNVSIAEITKQTTEFYHEDMSALGAISPHHEPRATEYVQEMINHIVALIEKGHAYEASSHVLFDVPSFKEYGALSGCNHDEILAGARVDVAPYKKSPQDFVLWKPSSDDQPGWDSPWGRGRPGWHIECSAMSEAILGSSFDIHGGGQDLMFPHHENEIAQSVSLHGCGSFARYWIHNGILTVNGDKMSKSLGNFLTVADLRAQASGEVLRMALMMSHYRSSLDWTKDSIARSKASLDRLYRAIDGAVFDETENNDDIDGEFLNALNDDLNTPLAIARLHEIASEINVWNNTNGSADAIYKKKLILKRSAYLLGILQNDTKAWFQGDHANDKFIETIESLMNERSKARAAKDFTKSDSIRQELLGMGIVLEDTADGTSWKRVP